MVSTLTLLVSFCCLGVQESPWMDLFDGQTLEGWTQRNGTATYRVEDGAIYGKTQEGSPNSFLCSNQTFGDFELMFEVKVDDRLNSGVQIRSQTRGGPKGRVNGPQVEIESSGPGGAESGYLYGEAAGGWMTPADSRQPHKHFRDGEWNAYRVLAVGPRIQVWINDVQVSDLIDVGKQKSHPRGFIGLQVHSIGKGQGPFEVSWRNIRIRDLEEADTFQSLFNGKDLEGWKTKGNWVVKDGGILGIEPREGEEGWQRYDCYLWSEKTYKNFVLDLEYTYPSSGNSGVFFRVGDLKDPVQTGIEAQILDSSQHQGEMTHHDHGGIIRTQGAAKNMSKAPGDWNRMILTCHENHLAVGLNGERIIDLDIENSAMKDRPQEGFIGLQDHGQPHNVDFRNIRIKELPPSVDLFNGKDLSGWYADIPAADGGKEVPPSFVVEDGILVSRGTPGGHLITDGSYANYRLTVEYRWPGEPGNCGILVHSSTPRRLYKMFPQSIECQLYVDNAGDFWCIGEDIQVPDMESRRGPKEKWGVNEGDARRILNLTDGSENPKGDWNVMVIECRDRSIDVWINGDHVNNGFDCTARSGQIAIQAEGAVCEFRKVRLSHL